MKLIEMVKGRVVRFKFYRKGELWYEIDGIGFMFPVPTSDCGDATFLDTDKATLFMRYVRKQLAELENEREA